MAAFTGTILGLAGAAAGAIGAGVSAYGNQQAMAAQKQQEAIRRTGMLIDFQRRRREQVRQSQMVRAQNVAVANAQGASGEGSSGLPGNLGGVSGRLTSNLRGINTNYALGNSMFDANAQETAASQYNAFGGTLGNLGGGLRSFSGSLVQSSEAINRITGYGGTYEPTQGTQYGYRSPYTIY